MSSNFNEFTWNSSDSKSKTLGWGFEKLTLSQSWTLRQGQGSIAPTCLRAAFTREDPKSVKIQSSHQYLFAHLGSGHIKAVHKMLVKLTPGQRMFSDLGKVRIGCNFDNYLWTSYLHGYLSNNIGDLRQFTKYMKNT